MAQRSKTDNAKTKGWKTNAEVLEHMKKIVARSKKTGQSTTKNATMLGQEQKAVMMTPDPIENSTPIGIKLPPAEYTDGKTDSLYEITYEKPKQTTKIDGEDEKVEDTVEDDLNTKTLRLQKEDYWVRPTGMEETQRSPENEQPPIPLPPAELEILIARARPRIKKTAFKRFFARLLSGRNRSQDQVKRHPNPVMRFKPVTKTKLSDATKKKKK